MKKMIIASFAFAVMLSGSLSASWWPEPEETSNKNDMNRMIDDVKINVEAYQQMDPIDKLIFHNGKIVITRIVIAAIDWASLDNSYSSKQLKVFKKGLDCMKMYEDMCQTVKGLNLENEEAVKKALMPFLPKYKACQQVGVELDELKKTPSNE